LNNMRLAINIFSVELLQVSCGLKAREVEDCDIEEDDEVR